MTGLSDRVRAVASKEYVEKARARGQMEFSIRVGEMQDVLDAGGFPKNHIPQICSALRSNKFLRLQDLELVKVEGPRSQMSTTVVHHYRFKGEKKGEAYETVLRHDKDSHQATAVDPFLKLRGLLEDVLRELGGGEEFLKSLRQDPEPGTHA